MNDIPGWMVAVGLALLLNMVLFGLLPMVVKDRPAGLESRLQQRAIPVIPEQPPPEEKEPPVPKETPSRPAPAAETKPVPDMPQPEIPLTISPDLPVLDSAPSLSPVSAPEYDAVYDESRLDFGLMQISRVSPLYPHMARARGIEGRVRIQFIVDRQGNCRDIKILEAEPDGFFENSAIQAVSSWRFMPGAVSGVPVNTRVETTIRFELN